MKRIPFYSPLCMLCAALVVLAACGKESDNTLPDSPPGAEALRVQATQLGFAEEDGKTRATTDEGTMKTTFEPGDAIGIFAVKGGVVQTDCKNLKLTMQSDGSWGGNTVFFTEGATYFAYSPYRDVAGINSAVSIDNIVANFTISNNQSTAALYAANDLMTSTTCTANKEAKTLTIAFEHRFALVEMERAYCKGKGEAYPLNNTLPSELRLLDLPSGVVFGYRKGGIMRFLLKPGSRSIAPVFLQGNSTYIVFETTPNPQINLTQGKRFKLKPQKKRDVQVGDYYYSDGSVFPQEWTKAGHSNSTGRIGIVYNTQMAESDKSRQWKNGYVMSAERVTFNYDSPWKEANATSGNAYYEWRWPLIYAMKTSGYDECQQIRSLSISSKFTHVLAANRLSSPPAGTSGWYLPSAAQWAHLFRNIGNSPNIYISDTGNGMDTEYLDNYHRVDAVFKQFSSTFIYDMWSFTLMYTTSTEAGNNSIWSFYLDTYSMTPSIRPNSMKNNVAIHYILMF